MGDANGLDPPDKSQAMEGDLVGDLVEKWGRELELEKKSGVNEWVGSSTSPPLTTLSRNLPPESPAVGCKSLPP